MTKLKPKVIKVDKVDREASIEDIAASRPSVFEADLRARLRLKKRIGLGMLPAFIVEEFERLAREAGHTNKRHFFYDLLRKAGAEIPPNEKMDGRKL